MFKILAISLAAAVLAGCASLLDERASAPGASSQAAQADFRASLDVLRRKPELASDELIRDLESFLRDREQRRQALLAAERQASLEAADRRTAFEAAERRAAQESAQRRAELEALPQRRPERRAEPASLPPAPAPAPALIAAQPERPVAAAPARTLVEAEQLFERARLLEVERRVAQAMPLYTTASRQGWAAATVRLMEIYSYGAEGVSRDYLTAVRYKDLAVQQGARLEYPPRR